MLPLPEHERAIADYNPPTQPLITFRRIMLSLHPLLTDHAVISAKRPRIKGNATPGNTVTVTLAGHTASTTADTSGGWLVEFPALPPGGPRPHRP